MNSSFKYWLSLIALFLVVTAMGARNLNADGIWYDEWWSLYNAGAGYFGPPLSPLEIWNRLAAEDLWQLPGYPWALSAWGNMVGWTEYATRALSLLAGILAIALTYRLALDVSGKRIVAFSAGATLGTSTWLIYYLHEMRTYSICVLLAALLLLLYWRMTRRAPNFLMYGTFLLATIALLYTHYFSALFIATLGLWHLARLRHGLPNRHWWLILMCFAVAGLTLLPLIATALRAAEITQTQDRAELDAVRLVSIVGDMIYVFSNTGVALMALLVFFSLRARRLYGFILFTMILLALDLAAYYFLKVNEIRYSMTVMPLFALIAGFGIHELSKLRVPSTLIISIWLIGAIMVDRNGTVPNLLNRTQQQPVREMSQILAPRLEEGDVVLNILGEGNIGVLQLHPIEHYFGSLPGRVEVLEIESRPSVQNYVERINEAVGDAQHLWIIYDLHWPSTEWSLLTYWLNEHNIYQCATIIDTDELRVLAFGRLSADAPVYRFGSGIEVQQIGATTVRDGVMRVWLGFSVPPDIPPYTYSVALHVEDSNGQLQTQADYGLPDPGQSCRMVEIPLNQLPDEQYHLRTIIYDWRSGERLLATTPDGENVDNPLMPSLND